MCFSLWLSLILNLKIILIWNIHLHILYMMLLLYSRAVYSCTVHICTGNTSNSDLWLVCPILLCFSLVDHLWGHTRESFKHSLSWRSSLSPPLHLTSSSVQHQTVNFRIIIINRRVWILVWSVYCARTSERINPNEQFYISEGWNIMNGMGLSLSEICCLFCCPPCPSRIAAKLAFLPPEPTYSFEVNIIIMWLL